LADELRERIDRVATSTGQTMAEVIRLALDAYLQLASQLASSLDEQGPGGSTRRSLRSTPASFQSTWWSAPSASRWWQRIASPTT